MDLLDLIKKRRSIKKFKQKPVERESLLNLIETACFSHSICNRQNIRYWVVQDPAKVDFVYQHSSLGWVIDGEDGLTDEKFAPPAYIAVTVPGSASHADYADAGAAFQNMALMSLQTQLGLFWIHAFSEEILKSFLNLPEEQTIIALIAVGHPAESPVAINIDPVDADKFFNLKDKAQKVPKLKTKYIVSWR
ncbi:MAG: nitroreductase family protein [Lentisphaeraceae bacterium]|nr:nitroreductase family protein [Lentisphaeraceae bacterium]